MDDRTAGPDWSGPVRGPDFWSEILFGPVRGPDLDALFSSFTNLGTKMLKNDATITRKKRRRNC